MTDALYFYRIKRLQHETRISSAQANGRLVRELDEPEDTRPSFEIEK